MKNKGMKNHALKKKTVSQKKARKVSSQISK